MNIKRISLLTLAILILALTACNQAEPQDTESLEGTSWVLETYRKSRPIPGTTITISFEDGEISGSAGCNSYFGSYELSGAMITFSTIAMTEMFCMDPEGVMDQESMYLESLGRAESYKIEDGKLVITFDGKEQLILVPQE